MKRVLLSLLAMAGMCAYAQTTFVVDDVTYTIKEGTSQPEVELTKAGDEAKKVTTLVIPSTVSDGTTSYKVTSIAAQAYQWSYATSIKVPGSVKTIGDCAFYYGYPSTIQLGNGIETLGANAFGSKNLT